MRDLDGWLAYISEQHWQTIDMGLQRMQDMVTRLNLHSPAAKVITVAGTNGKGSTCYAAEALLLQAGISVGTTLSPHVRRFNERVRINGAEADDDLLCSAFAAIDAQRNDLPLTYFEFSALAALWCFKAQKVDVCILEIGLGGRLDAFNVIDADIAVITSIGLDHQQFLGETLEAIGAEKAGILRPHQEVILGPDMPATVLQAAAELSLRPKILGDTWQVRANARNSTWDLYKNNQCQLREQPYHQCAPQNLIIAYLATLGLTNSAVSVIAEVSPTLQMPGRMQQHTLNGRRIVLDVAHNPAAAAFLAREMMQRNWHPKLILCGMLRDKDHAGVYAEIAAQTHAPWWLLDTAGERQLTGHELQERLPPASLAKPVAWDNLMSELSTATQSGDVILAFGSFDLVARVNELININVT
ncbi:MAG: Mur ligase family protein [Pseudomonadaceae bacterium]|nr:Mur ligase family protein [Pseudomonadaceae bacterium]